MTLYKVALLYCTRFLYLKMHGKYTWACALSWLLELLMTGAVLLTPEGKLLDWGDSMTTELAVAAGNIGTRLVQGYVTAAVPVLGSITITRNYCTCYDDNCFGVNAFLFMLYRWAYQCTVLEKGSITNKKDFAHLYYPTLQPPMTINEPSITSILPYNSSDCQQTLAHLYFPPPWLPLTANKPSLTSILRCNPLWLPTNHLYNPMTTNEPSLTSALWQDGQQLGGCHYHGLKLWSCCIVLLHLWVRWVDLIHRFLRLNDAIQRRLLLSGTFRHCHQRHLFLSQGFLEKWLRLECEMRQEMKSCLNRKFAEFWSTHT